MWYLFNTEKRFFGTCNNEPDQKDLAERGEFAVYSNKFIAFDQVRLIEKDDGTYSVL